MKLLAIDTATEACSAAIYHDGEVIQRYQVAPRLHAEIILSMCGELLAQAGLTLTDLDALAFGRGPGAFTGVRIAAGVIQGLAFATDLPVAPISTLAALAQGQWRLHGHARVMTAIDARINEVYWAAYESDAQVVQEIIPEQVCAAGAVNLPEGPGWVPIGSGWAAYASELQARAGSLLKTTFVDKDVLCYPAAQDVATLATRAVVNNQLVAAEQALPVYLRDNVAQKKKSDPH